MSFSADYFERKEDLGVAEHDSRYMGKLIQILPDTGSFKVSLRRFTPFLNDPQAGHGFFFP